MRSPPDSGWHPPVSSSVRQVEVRHRHWRIKICPRRTSADTGELRYCPVDCTPPNFRHGQFCVRQCPRRTSLGGQSAGQNRSPADNFVSASVRGGLRLGGHWRTPNLSEADNCPPWELPYYEGLLTIKVNKERKYNATRTPEIRVALSVAHCRIIGSTIAL